MENCEYFLTFLSSSSSCSSVMATGLETLTGEALLYSGHSLLVRMCPVCPHAPHFNCKQQQNNCKHQQNTMSTTTTTTSPNRLQSFSSNFPFFEIVQNFRKILKFSKNYEFVLKIIDFIFWNYSNFSSKNEEIWNFQIKHFPMSSNLVYKVPKIEFWLIICSSFCTLSVGASFFFFFLGGSGGGTGVCVSGLFFSFSWLRLMRRNCSWILDKRNKTDYKGGSRIFYRNFRFWKGRSLVPFSKSVWKMRIFHLNRGFEHLNPSGRRILSASNLRSWGFSRDFFILPLYPFSRSLR